jgi:hypothetical protein
VAASRSEAVAESKDPYKLNDIEACTRMRRTGHVPLRFPERTRGAHRGSFDCVASSLREDATSLRMTDELGALHAFARHLYQMPPNGQGSRGRGRRHVPHVQHLVGEYELKIVDQRSIRTHRLGANP